MPFAFSAGTSQLLSLVLIGFYGCMVALIVMQTDATGLTGPFTPLGVDFIAYYTASVMGQAGTLETGFDPHVFQAAKDTVIPDTSLGFLWLYPPMYALLILPLSFLPYGAAYAVWSLTGLGLAGLTMWRLLACREDGQAISIPQRRHVMLLCFAFPGAYICIQYGQNALLTATFFGMAAHCLLKRRDVEAGVWIALLLIKPQFGLLIPPALLLAGRWRAFAAASGFSLLFIGVSTAYFGLPYWEAFFSHRSIPFELLEFSDQNGMLLSAFALVRGVARLLGAGEMTLPIAYAGHWIAATGMAGYTLMAIRHKGLTALTLSLLIITSVMITPYAFHYELALLMPAGVLFFVSGARLSAVEGQVLILAFCLPLALGTFYTLSGLSLGVLVPLLCLVLVARHIGPVPGLRWLTGRRPAMAWLMKS